ncbi:MAG: mechanosensitive ion channel family protein [Candidatus Margulisbacteria bacterium]|nr:mechanosensitive ion channel family protein [Candidatus Margulisiibacteriota bacterium]
MEEFVTRFIQIWTDFRYLIAIGAYVIWLCFAWVIIRTFDHIIRRLVRKTPNKIDDIILAEAHFPFWLISIIVGFYVVSITVGMPKAVQPFVSRFTELSVVFLVIYFFIRIIINIIRLAGEVNQGLRSLVPTFSRIANIFIFGAATMMVMDIFGISVTPILASLGIAGIAIGLAMQDTLSNFFAGIYILINQPVRNGDYIELENGLKGYIFHVGWRETRIKTLLNNYVVVPNSKLSQSIITNYNLPQSEMSCLVKVGVSYDSDLEEVEKVTLQVAKEVMKKVEGGVTSVLPLMRYHTFNDFSIDFTVVLTVSKFVDKYTIISEFIKALHKRYNKEGIVIPFPIRTIQMEKK